MRIFIYIRDILATHGGMSMFYLATQPTIQDLGINYILGGFGLFLIGITLLGDGLKEVAGPKIKDYIEKYTNNIFMAIIMGALITGLIQSSSAATVISISLVRAGLMTLDQAIGIAIGANIGTTITSIMIGLKIDQFGYYFVFVGAILFVFSKRKKVKDIAFVLFAFGITFVGLTLMGERLNLLQEFTFFQNFIAFMSRNPWLALIGGALSTAIINSSSAFIAIVQKIYAGGGIDIIVVIALILGSNIGTTITAFIASMGGSISAKRAGLFHTLYNMMGSVVIMMLLKPYSQLILWISHALGTSAEFEVAIVHFLFNLIFAFVVIPFLPKFMQLLKTFIPGEDKRFSRTKLIDLNEELITSFPEGAMQVSKQAIIQMGELVMNSIKASHEYLLSGNEDDFEIVQQIEEIINGIDTELTTYLLKIVKSSTSEDIIDNYTSYLETIKNYERMSDLSTNSVEYFSLIYENKEKLSDDALNDLNTMYLLLTDMLNRALDIYKNDDVSQIKALLKDEEYLDIIETKYREKHFQRLADGTCTTKITSSIYVDILRTLERIGDHGVNVARFVSSPIKKHD